MKRDTIYSSSNDAFWKSVILVLTLGISVLASFIDTKSCYVTVCVQAVNNMYDFYRFTDNKLYEKEISSRTKIIIIFSVIAIIASIIGMINIYPKITQNIWGKLISILLVALPLVIVYGDYKINIEKENETEESV